MGGAMSTYQRVFSHIKKSQNVTAAETVKREIELLLKAKK
jgi:hypothetical protein